MNSKWQINRVGLVDFWYYDDEEFEFLDGRMLLRGANGSGKSVTMQSFIPLLLDGNMRPERLDPFGSRARKMENYLLEEGDAREERTGYLYMEFKRAKNEEYLSLGIGMRARKNKKLDSWYFCITDGRRIGRDLFLYKDVQNKITYTKTELRNRIGDGGKVMESQGEYIQCVNRVLFGFETQEEYKELLELLIQLRTPKLSKDFKPTVINEILSSSLQTLSEDDLRPMSEAIENMDSLKTNLDTLNESVKAAGQIERVYDQYNKIVLYDKALLLKKAVKDAADYDKAAEELDRDIIKCGEEGEKEEQHYRELKQEERILTEEKQSLDESDATRLKEQELKIQSQFRERQEERQKKEQQEEEKRDKEREILQRIRELSDGQEILSEDMEQTLADMETSIEHVSFDEFSFMSKEFREKKEEPYSFEGHKKLLNDYKKKVDIGKAVLQEEKNAQETYDRYLKEMDDCQNERDRAEREQQQTENQLHETKAELTEHICQWERENEKLHLSGEVMQEIFRRIETYRWGSDYSEIRELCREKLHEKEQEFREENQQAKQALREVKEEKASTEEELEQWRKQKDPEPDQPECVRRNREILRERGIPYQQFYKTVDFDCQISEEEACRLEEALLHMGILDALLIPAEYREQVLGLDAGVCDRYIFSDVRHVKRNLLQVLEVDNGEDDILFFQSISNVLSAVGCKETDQEETADSWIDREGNYRLGVLEGTVTKNYQARFIGVRAREKYRQQKIEALEEVCRELADRQRQWEERLEEIEGEIQKLKSEWEQFPGDTDLKVAAKECADCEYQLERETIRLRGAKEQVDRSRKHLDEIRMQVREKCEKCYLAPRLDVFCQASDELSEYKELLTGLEITHGKYLNGLQSLRGQQEYLDELEQDLDEIRYERSRIEQKLKEEEASLLSVRQQLALTDYEEIRERLDYCMERLRQIPGEIEATARRQQDWKNRQENLQSKRQENETARAKAARRKEWLCRVFAQEYHLGYVEKSFAINEDMEDQADRVCDMLAGTFGNKKQSDILGSLQQVYHENRAYLLEYQITLQSLFGEAEEENSGYDMSVKRIDISGKYRGTAVKFKELIERLKEDAAELTQLLNDKDRELFEDILANTISKKIRGKIQASKRWVEKMNVLMESMQTSSGLKLSLKWKNKRADSEEQLDTGVLVELLQKDVEIMREEEAEKLSRHFRSKIQEARKLSSDTGAVQSFHGTMREVLDYRKWFEFQLECQKTGEKKKELTDRVFFTFSGGEKAMAMYVPLFSAVVAKYAGARKDAPRLISLDEAFAGVDETNIRDMFRLMVEFEFNFMINSQILWGDYDTVPGLAIYQLIRPENAKYVSVIHYIWNGRTKRVVGGSQT